MAVGAIEQRSTNTERYHVIWYHDDMQWQQSKPLSVIAKKKKDFGLQDSSVHLQPNVVQETESDHHSVKHSGGCETIEH